MISFIPIAMVISGVLLGGGLGLIIGQNPLSFVIGSVVGAVGGYLWYLLILVFDAAAHRRSNKREIRTPVSVVGELMDTRWRDVGGKIKGEEIDLQEAASISLVYVWVYVHAATVPAGAFDNGRRLGSFDIRRLAHSSDEAVDRLFAISGDHSAELLELMSAHGVIRGVSAPASTVSS